MLLLAQIIDGLDGGRGEVRVGGRCRPGLMSGLAGLASFYRGAVYRPQPAAPAAGPLVTPSEEVQRHAAGEAGTGPGA